jgi:glutathione S-transferase
MLKVLGRANSANVQKVLWCCAELGLPYAREDIGGPFGKNKEPAYLALNPNGLVPTIIDDGAVIWESNTILRYLAVKNSSEALCPSQPGPRAVCEQWMDWQLSVLGPAIGPVFMGLVRTPAEQRDAKAIDAARDRTSAAMAILDGWLGKHPFLGGDRFTIADIPAGVMTYRWFFLDIKREDYANVKAWYDRLAAREGFRKYIAIGLT